MPQITQLDNDPTPNNNDLLVTVDVGAGTTKNISREQFFTGAPLPADTVDTQAIADGAVTAGKIDFATLNFEPNVTFSESPANRSFKKWGNLVIIMYQGESKTHSNGTLIFTLPVEARPSVSTHFPFAKNGTAYGYATINTDGSCSVNNISSSAANGRVVFNVSYFV